MLPNFLILGAPRSGTTTLYEGLKRHPQAFCSPIKEPMFFILRGERQYYPGPKKPIGTWTIEEYKRLFRGAEKHKAVGEATPCYLASPKAASEIHRLIPEARMIAILRHPVDRAYSHFLFNRLQGAEPITDFEQALAAEAERDALGWFPFWRYKEWGMYGKHITDYFSIFKPDQFLFLLFEDLLNDPDGLFRRIFSFLQLDTEVHSAAPLKYNPSGIPRSRIIHAFLTKPNWMKQPVKRILSHPIQYDLLTLWMCRNLVKPQLSKDIHSRILGLFREDIFRTQDLIHRDLSDWLAD